MTLRNDRRLHVRNGGRGTIQRVDTDALTVSVAFVTGETVVVPADYLSAGHLTHAYAMTVHKAQGLTCDRAFTLGSDALYREQGYVAMSRGRLGNHLYVVGPRPLDPDSAPHAPTRERTGDDALLAGLAVSKAQHLAIDHADGQTVLTWTTPELLSEQRRLRAVVADAPEDRSHDTESLMRGRNVLFSDLVALDQQHAALLGRSRSWRERRRGPDPQLLLVEAKQTDVTNRLAAVEHDLDIAQSSNRSREEFMMDHSADIVRLEQIGNVLADRVDRAVCRAINDPPAYLTRALGFLPDDGTSVGDWIEAATIIESYRLEHDIIDKRHALGREPRDPIDRAAWQEAAWTVEALMSRPVPSIEVPDHDVGLELDP